MNRSGTGWLLLAGPLLLATSSAQANYSPNDWRQYQLTGESSQQLAARITEITYELKAHSSNAPYQQLRVYRRFDWQSSELGCTDRAAVWRAAAQGRCGLADPLRAL